MTLVPGSNLAHYEVLEPIGKGGMGEVYRARDSKHKRDVALKVLPEAFASDTERMARFEREALWEAQPSLSPDGRFVAYISDVSGGTLQIFIQPFPGPGGRRQISTDGGRWVWWSPAGGEILFDDAVRRG